MSSPAYPLTVALIGAGGIARAHAEAYASQPDRCTLAAVADIAPKKAEQLAAEVGCRAYPDMYTMLDEVRPDAVSICTPPAIHLQCARAAAERGVHILCEKPLSHDLHTAREMVSAADKGHVLLMTALCHRFHGPIEQLKERIAAGQLGQILYFQNRFAFRFSGVEDSWFVIPEVAGGGILIDTEVHAIDLFRHLIGEVAAVSAQISTTLPIQVEDSAVVVLRSMEGIPGVVSCSWVSPPGEATVEVFGTEGTAWIDYDADAGQLRVQLAGDETSTLVPYTGPDRFANETAHFLECIVEGAPPRADGREGARVVEIIEAAYRAARNGTVELVEPGT